MSTKQTRKKSSSCDSVGVRLFGTSTPNSIVLSRRVSTKSHVEIQIERVSTFGNAGMRRVDAHDQTSDSRNRKKCNRQKEQGNEPKERDRRKLFCEKNFHCTISQTKSTSTTYALKNRGLFRQLIIKPIDNAHAEGTCSTL